MKTANSLVCQGIRGPSPKARKEGDLACPLGSWPPIGSERPILALASRFDLFKVSFSHKNLS
jgi:hypothetical protein